MTGMNRETRFEGSDTLIVVDRPNRKRQIIIAAVLISGFVSLTLTPMLCSRWLRRGEPDAQHGRWYRATERAW